MHRAFLCGNAYEHRRESVENRILELAGAFAIDVAPETVISNHYHVVLHVALATWFTAQYAIALRLIIG